MNMLKYPKTRFKEILQALKDLNLVLEKDISIAPLYALSVKIIIEDLEKLYGWLFD